MLICGRKNQCLFSCTSFEQSLAVIDFSILKNRVSIHNNGLMASLKGFGVGLVSPVKERFVCHLGEDHDRVVLW